MAKIMVVDDSQFMRMRMVRLLSDNGYEVIEAEDGEQAVKTYDETRPDVVLMDMAMPNKNGRQALIEIRRLDAQAKVIMLTSMDQQLIVLQAMQSGAKDFLVKPCEPVKILESLRKVLS